MEIIGNTISGLKGSGLWSSTSATTISPTALANLVPNPDATTSDIGIIGEEWHRLNLNTDGGSDPGVHWYNNSGTRLGYLIESGGDVFLSQQNTATNSGTLRVGGSSTHTLKLDAKNGNSSNRATIEIDANSSGNVEITGTLSKTAGSFKIPHPDPTLTDTHYLVHSFIEGPKADLIYRGTVTLAGAPAVVNMDTEMGTTPGTWELLCDDIQVFTSNETGYDAVKGNVAGAVLTIECVNAPSTDTISWMVVAKRKDQAIKDSVMTDDNGDVLVEVLKTVWDGP